MLEQRPEAGAGATRRWDGPSNRSGAGKAESATRGVRRSARSAVLLALAFLTLVGTVEAAWYSPSWVHRKKLTLNGTLVPAAQTNFPVLVSLTDAQLGANAQASGNDILFTAADGTTKLAHEIESYTSPAGTVVAWVNVPALASGTDTTIYMYYGNAAAGNQQNKNAVWDTGFKGVWHLSEAGAAPASYLDSTAYANNATSPSHPSAVVGRIGNARNFNGTANYITAANTASLQLTTSLTLEGWIWVRPNSFLNFCCDVSPIARKGEANPNDYQLSVRAYNPNAPSSAGPGHAGLSIEQNDDDGLTALNVIAGGTWYHVAGTWDGVTATVYVDGTPVASGAYASAISPDTRPLYIGGRPGADLHTGRLDEVRISNVARSNSWIRTEYNNQANQGVGAGKFILALGAEEVTAVKLMSFEASPLDSAVSLEWRTGSELDNLGFHVYRGPSAEGPWTRLTSSLILGLGSSPLGQAYSWLDSGLVNGQRYYYRLEDVDTSSVSTFHGPVSAVPQASASPPTGGGGGGGGEPGDESEPGGSTKTSCPAWVLAAYGSPVSPSVTCTKHGDPESVSLDVLSHDASSATLELRTGGFWALHGPGADGLSGARELSGTVRVFVPGFDFPVEPRAPALPLRRALVDAVVGKKVSLVSAEALDLRGFRGLRPSAVGLAEMNVSWDGTVRPARRSLAASFLTRGYVPQYVARLGGTVFQGERKSAVVEITPIRFDGSRQELVLAGRVRVKLAFWGREDGEGGVGSRGRSLPRKRALFREVLAQLQTSGRGLYAVSYEALFPLRPRGFATSYLRLQRQGEAVAFHVEPAGPVFGPRSVLYFFADRTVSSTDYSGEVAYELVRSSGREMGVALGHPVGAPVVSSSTGFASFETNRIYQPGLLEAPDIWLWDAMASGVARTEAFTLSGVDTASSEVGRLVVQLQGGSESGVTADHHVRLSVNGVDVGEATFAGKQPYRLDVLVPASVLREGANELALVNVGDTGVSSLVFLDKFSLSYPQAASVRGGVFEGVWGEGGAAEVGGLSGSPIVVDVTGAATGDVAPNDIAGTSGVKWVTGFETAAGVVRFEAEAGRRYLVVSREGLLSPRVARVALSTLREGTNQADYLVIGPGEFLEAAAPLLERRRSQGLVSRVVSFEEIASEFGRGQPSAEAIKAFLSYAYHSWQRPSPRYVLLLGDSTYDPRRFVGTSWASPLPALWAKTSYLWTASDPALAAVNGEDLLPDLAIGRLPATTREQAETLVGKLLSWEDSGQGLVGKAVLVADNPDAAGDFEADVEDIRASFLAGRSTTTLKLSELGGATRPAILGAFDDGASLMSYVGHGGAAVWASENVLNSWDVPALRAQTEQPLLLTMNCLNGYFVAPNFDALSEALLKAEGRGAIAAFSPSGLSVDGPAHQYHRAVMAELVSGTHERLGDAILAAQRDYAETGLMPELLAVYHLLGDPAMRIR